MVGSQFAPTIVSWSETYQTPHFAMSCGPSIAFQLFAWFASGHLRDARFSVSFGLCDSDFESDLVPGGGDGCDGATGELLPESHPMIKITTRINLNENFIVDSPNITFLKRYRGHTAKNGNSNGNLRASLTTNASSDRFFQNSPLPQLFDIAEIAQKVFASMFSEMNRTEPSASTN